MRENEKGGNVGVWLGSRDGGVWVVFVVFGVGGYVFVRPDISLV